MHDKERLDAALVTRGLAQSREKAQALILSGCVFVGGQRASKASQQVAPADELTVRGAPFPYVSRGGLKLEKAMEVFQLDVRDAVAMDVGASTGGFTDVLLRAGARRVYAIDVGYGQLDWKLRNDPRVTVLERTNARYLTPSDFPEPPTLGVMDVSFISIRLILPALRAILGPSGRVVTLVKPQFEAGRERVGKKGVVRDASVHCEVLRSLLDYAGRNGWCVRAASFSPITGPEGNIEFLFDISPAQNDGSTLTDADVESVVQAAHRAFGREGL